jgi:NadR type nicotinamide-nucleotide adenylyltransferase
MEKMPHTSVIRMKKIAIMGPESTGKSSMAEFLARHYGSLWVPEYAREYCDQLGKTAEFEDELAILKGQLERESEFIKRDGEILFFDTMFLTVKIYSEHVFKTYPREIDKYLESHRYDFFLIMDIDLPWEDDPLREFPELRSYFMEIHIREIKALGVPYEIISGLGSIRKENALKAVDYFLKKID